MHAIPTVLKTPSGGSMFLPSLDLSQSSPMSEEECSARRSRKPTVESPLEKMNSFLESKDISPVRFTLKTPWSEANERTRRRHTRKAKQAVVAVLDEVAPNQVSDLWTSVISSVDKENGSSSGEEEDVVDAVMLGALVECYQNADSWGVRRQILSIMANIQV